MRVRITKLSNGIRVVSEKRKTVQTVSLGVWVGVGSRDETESLNGITHCLEHMLFKGTEKRSATDIAYEIEAVGGHLNAYTTRDNTLYYARVLKDDLPLAMDILSDILQYSRFDEKELEREKDVILQEIGQTNDTPDDIVFDNLQATAFKGQPLGRSILGTEENVEAFTSADLHQYLQNNYTSGNIVISAVGALDHNEMVRLVQEYFTSIPTGKPVQTDRAKFTGGRHLKRRKLDQIHLTYGWNGCSFDDDSYYPMQVYSTILGGGMSSRLFQEVREKRGLAYSVYSFASSHFDTGMFGIYAGTGPESAEKLTPVIRGEMEALATGLRAGEIDMAKAQLKAGLMMALEATTSRMEQLGRQLLIFDRIIPVEEMQEKVEAVGEEDVLQLASSIIEQKKTAFAAIGGKEIKDAAL
ncbi:peptidase M16 [Kordiimonas sediminis]|uniref:Peptidase M16 n=1 Tax=Kordiimonas sediminis TaxID=1735581 RepID=A0A919AZ28_9PROT|nr:pitrilysin family protein [Kordiimonas sediminis]GHF30120.1 peptidase M16 [Kordiimonas sediminis]